MSESRRNKRLSFLITAAPPRKKYGRSRARYSMPRRSIRIFTLNRKWYSLNEIRRRINLSARPIPAASRRGIWLAEPLASFLEAESATADADIVQYPATKPRGIAHQ